MKNIVAKNIKDLFQIYFVMKIYLWTKNIFLYRMTDDLMQIYFKREYYIFNANILSLKEKKKHIFSVIFVPNLRIIFLYKYRSCIRVNPEIEEAETRV